MLKTDKKMENLYSVKCPNTGRYIVWCDEHWYETDKEPVTIFEKEKAEAIVKQLRNHYIYNAVVVDADGNELAAKEPENPMKQEEKKSFGKISINRKFFAKL